MHQFSGVQVFVVEGHGFAMVSPRFGQLLGATWLHHGFSFHRPRVHHQAMREVVAGHQVRDKVDRACGLVPWRDLW